MTTAVAERMRVSGRFDGVDVWSISLDANLGLRTELQEMLTEDERARAARFYFALDRARFVVGRGLLRQRLADYVGMSPDELRFRYSHRGKPSLAHEAGVAFNVSHAGGRMIIAVGDDAEIGVDIERRTRELPRERVPEHFFAPREVEELFALPANARPEAFLSCWTRKEAYIKARGEGLALPLHDFEVTLKPDEAPRLRRTAWSQSEPSEWALYDVSDTSPGYIAALAVRTGPSSTYATDRPERSFR